MTIIQVRYSSANTTPANGSLITGELAYSGVSKKLFIGDGYNGSPNVIGGQFYTDLINSNTSLSVANTIVVRDSQGSFSVNVITANSFVGPISGNLNGNSATSSKLLNPFVITLGSDASGNISIDGSANVTLNVELTNSGVSSGTYGNTRYIPTFTVGTDGRITGVSNVAIDFPDAADFSQASYDQANSSYLHANAAFAAANTALNSNAHANAAFNVANTANTTATSSSSYSNSAFAVANTANTTATAASSYANSAYQIANSASSYANGAFVAANTALLSYGHVNAAFNIANTAITNSVNTSLLLTEIFANVTATETQIQTVGNYANAAYRHANASYTNSNTKFNSSGGTISGDVNVTGNLTISGNVTYVATNQLNLGDAIIALNADLGQTATPTENAGIEVERGNQANASIIWNETVDRWQFTGNTGTSNIASSAAESYANSSFEAANAAYAFSGQTQLLVLGAAIAANAGGSYANSAFLTANAAFNGTTGSQANLAYAHANAAFNTANASGLQFSISSYTHANAAFDAANVAYITGGVIAGAYANAAYRHANSAFLTQNLNSAYANIAYNHANASYQESNSATLIALSAYALANNIVLSEGTEIANAASNVANLAIAQVNSIVNFVTFGYEHANAGFIKANVSGLHANAAYDLANTKFSSSGGTISGDVTVSGNLRVDGDRATFFVSALSIEDNLIDIATDQVGAPSLNAGIRILRGDESPVQFRWNESFDRWQYTLNGTNFINIGSESDGVYANAALAFANSASSYANSAFEYSNTTNQRSETSGVYANSAFAAANSASSYANGAFLTANSASSYANGAFAAANSASSYANGAFAAANSASLYANGAFAAANSASLYANSAFAAANTADQIAVTSGVYANAAFAAANNIVVVGNIIALGTNTAGRLVSPAVTLTTETTVTNGLAQINDILGKLVPQSPGAFPNSTSLSVSTLSTYRMTNFTQTDRTTTASKQASAGSTVTSVRRSAAYTTNTFVDVGPGESGTITLVKNNVATGAVTFTSSSANGTYGDLIITDSKDYSLTGRILAADFWRSFDCQGSGTVANGWNEIYLSHTGGANTSTIPWYYDDSAPGTPTFETPTIVPSSTTVIYSSTVPHYTSATTFLLGVNVSKLSGDMFPTSNTFFTGTAGGAFGTPTSNTYSLVGITYPLARNYLVSSGSIVVNSTSTIISGFGSSATGPSVTVDNSYSTASQGFTTALANTILYKTGTASAMEETTVTFGSTVGTGSGPASRIINPGTTDNPTYTASAALFNSQTSTLTANDATIVASTLKHDQTNYSTGYLPAGPNLSTGRTGAQYFTFRFVRNPLSKFDIKFSGTIAGLWVAVPGSDIDTAASSTNGWVSMASSYGGSGVPSVGCALGGTVTLNSLVSEHRKTCTFGTVSTADTLTNEVYVRIKLTSGQSVTALSLESSSN